MRINYTSQDKKPEIKQERQEKIEITPIVNRPQKTSFVDKYIDDEEVNFILFFNLLNKCVTACVRAVNVQTHVYTHNEIVNFREREKECSFLSLENIYYLVMCVHACPNIFYSPGDYKNTNFQTVSRDEICKNRNFLSLMIVFLET